MKTKLALFAILQLAALICNANTESVNGVTYSFDLRSGCAVLTGASCENTDQLTILDIPQTLGGCAVEGIAFQAFRDNTNLISVNMPDTIRDVGPFSFAGCSSIESVHLSTSVTNLGFAAFSGNVALRHINLPDGLVSIGGQCFYRCTTLFDVEFPSSLRVIEDSAFSRSGLIEATLPDIMDSIGSNVFSYCPSLASICTPREVESIGGSMAVGCTNLVYLNFPSNLTTIPARYAHSTSLSEFEILESVTNIESYAFSSSDRLSVRVPSGVAHIGSSAFLVVSNVVIEATNLVFDASAFAFAKNVCFTNTFSSGGKVYRSRYLSGQIGSSVYSHEQISHVSITSPSSQEGWLRWDGTACVYPIEYCDTRGADNTNPCECTSDESLVFTPLPDVPGWHFAGWDPVSVNVGNESPLTVTAKWDRVYHDVTVDGVVSRYEYGTEVLLSTAKEMICGYTNMICLGWSGTGSAPSSGIETQVVFTVTCDSAIEWNRQTNYWLDVSSDADTRVSFDASNITTNGCWVPEGTTLCAEAAAETPHYHILGWMKSDSSGEERPYQSSYSLQIQMTAPQVGYVARSTIDTFSVSSDGTISEHDYGSSVTLFAPDDYIVGETNYVYTGWTGSGDIPAHGLGTQTTFAVTQVSSLWWLCETNYLVSAVSEAGGAAHIIAEGLRPANIDNSHWVSFGSTVDFGAVVSNGFRFVKWTDCRTGFCVSTNSSVSVKILAPTSLIAEYEPNAGMSGMAVLQRYPWNGMVDVEFELDWYDPEELFDVELLVEDADKDCAFRVDNVVCADRSDSCLRFPSGRHHLVWDADADVPPGLYTNVTYSIVATLRRPVDSREGADEQVVASCLQTIKSSRLDNREGARYARKTEPIVFSSGWVEDCSRVVLKVDGSNVVSSLIPTNGVYSWVPEFGENRTVTLVHTSRSPNGNQALTATFVVESHTVWFDLGEHAHRNGGGELMQPIVYGYPAEAPAFDLDPGWQFLGWSGGCSAVTNDMTISAVVEPIVYRIDYANLLGAENGNTTTFTVTNDVAFFPPGDAFRKRFVRWEPSRVDLGTASNVTVTAVWEDLPPHVYVDGVNGDDDNSGFESSKAVATIAAAYDKALDDDIIIVAAGVYDGIAADKGKTVHIKSSNGPAETIIDGGNIVRCFKGDEKVTLEGFTLRNGYDPDIGGGVYGGRIVRCIISNCTSDWDGAGAAYARLESCLIVDNLATYGYGGGCYSGQIVNCTVVGNESGDIGGGVYAPDALFNTILWRNEAGSREESDAAELGQSAAGNNLVGVDPLFRDELHGDFTVQYESPCRDSGTNSCVTLLYDLAGNSRVIGGAVDVGAYEFASVVEADGVVPFAPSGEIVEYEVPSEWLIWNGLAREGDPFDLVQTALRSSYLDSSMSWWDAFVAGLDSSNTVFRATIEIENGEPIVSWEPQLSIKEQTLRPRKYTVFGKASLDDSDPWSIVTDENLNACRFFKVSVELSK